MALILLVDDSGFARNQVARILRKDGHEIVEADNGLAGLKAAMTHRPACIVTDLLMPEMDGIRFLTALREGKLRIPTIVLTADVQGKTRDEALSLGALDVLNKPPREESLLSAVRRALCTEGDG